MNSFNHISQLKIVASKNSSGKTILRDQFFTSPFKIMKPFARNDGGIQIFQQTASAGIMAGDEQQHNFIIEKGATLELLSQSFEKIFKMEADEKAVRKVNVCVEEDATFIYNPLPCIPFAGSNFENHTTIELSSGSKLIYSDCICCGRKAYNEDFDYKAYKNLVEIKYEGKLIYRDNTVFEGSDCGKYPEKKNIMKSPVMYGNFSHSASILLFGFNKKPSDFFDVLNLENKLLYIEDNLSSESKDKKNTAPLVSITLTEGNGIAIRILSNSAEQIQNIFEKIIH